MHIIHIYPFINSQMFSTAKFPAQSYLYLICMINNILYSIDITYSIRALKYIIFDKDTTSEIIQVQDIYSFRLCEISLSNFTQNNLCFNKCFASLRYLYKYPGLDDPFVRKL